MNIESEGIPITDIYHKSIDCLPKTIDVLMDTVIENKIFKVNVIKRDNPKECWSLAISMDELLTEYSCYIDEFEEEMFSGYYYTFAISNDHKLLFSEKYEKDYFCAKELGRTIWDKLVKVGFEVTQHNA